jgi:hypothetical protein
MPVTVCYANSYHAHAWLTVAGQKSHSTELSPRAAGTHSFNPAANEPMNTYDQLFQHLQDGQPEKVMADLHPLLDTWAQDVLRPTLQRSNRDWRRILIHDGGVKLHFALKRRMTNGTITSGNHLINSLRLVAQKEMQKSYRRLMPVPTPTARTRQARLKVGGSAVKSWELRRQVTIHKGSQPSGEKVGRTRPVTDSRFFARDEGRQERYWRYLELFRTSAMSAAADDQEALLVGAILTGRSSVSQAAALAGIARETARDRLHNVGAAIIQSASPELRDLWLEFKKSIWEAAGASEIADKAMPKSMSPLSQPRLPAQVKASKSTQHWTNCGPRPPLWPQRGIGLREGKDTRPTPSLGATRSGTQARPRETSRASAELRRR